MEKTRTGKAVYKTFVQRAPAMRPVTAAGYGGWASDDMIFLYDGSLSGTMTDLSASQSFFGHLPRVWSYLTPQNKMTGETCVPIGALDEEAFSLFAQPEKLGLNFMAKGADWPEGHLQIPRQAARFIPTVMPILGFLRANLPDQRLWPAVEVVFKISAGDVKKDKSGLDPFLDKKQAADWHTDGDSVNDLARLRGQAKDAFTAVRRPASNALAFLKQRLIVSSAFPTAFSDGWEFATEAESKDMVVRSNGYPERRVINPVVFPAGTVVAFTNNNMHTAIRADEDRHRCVMIVSGVIRHGALKSVFEKHPDMRCAFSEEAPDVIRVPAGWHDGLMSKQDILCHSASKLPFVPQGAGPR